MAIEKDDQLYELLKNTFAKEISSEQLTLIHDDILNFDIALVNVSYKLIANIPYNITGAIIEKFLTVENQPSLMVLLVQKEVAQRIVAADGKGSILSNSVWAYGTPRYVETVKAGSFAPAPQVDSAILAIENISKGFLDKESEQNFFKILKAGFQSKRKKLSSNISNVVNKENTLKTFDKLGLDPNIRAENLSISQWKELFQELFNKTD